jgi:serine/threonine-protein kinase HipA
VRLRVTLHATTVGFLDLAYGNTTTFRFAPSYLTMADRPVLGRWYEERLSLEFVEKGLQNTLPPFFQNWLPEPNSTLREILARKADVPSHRELPLLAVLGEDLSGAAVVRRDEHGEDDEPDERGGIAVGPSSVDMPPTGALRFSLAGMQLKFSVTQSGTKLTLPVTGDGGRFIMKLPSAELPHVPQNEFSMMTWAHEAGIRVPAVQLVHWQDVENLPRELEFQEEIAFLVERFDRPRDGGARIHQEDFAQILGKRPIEKYGRDGQVTLDRMGKIIAVIAGEDDFEEFVRRLVFAILCGNPDVHLKNWSVWYPDRKKPRLAPAYDLVSRLAYPRVSSELACRLAGEWEPSRVRSWHFGILASRAGQDTQKGVALALGSAARIREAWAQVRSTLPLTAELRSTLDTHLSKTKL